MSPSHVLSLCAISEICRHSLGYLCVLSATCRRSFYHFEIHGSIQHRDKDCYTVFDDITHREWGYECCCYQFVYWTFFEVWTMFLLKNWPFYGQFGCKYDRACIWDQIAYYFIKFRKVWMLESDSFNYEILAGETVLGAWSSPILHIGRSFNTK